MFMAVARYLLAYLAVSAFLVGLLLLQLFPYRPETIAGWVLLFVLALPITLIGEAIGSWLFSNHLARTVDERTKAQSFSWFRIAYGLATYLIMIAIVGVALVFWKLLT